MYSLSIIEANIARVVDAERLRRADPKFTIHRFPTDVIADMCERLEALIDKSSLKEDGSYQFKRDLTKFEQTFLDNELMLCALDFRHYCENYAVIELASSSDRPEGWDLLVDDRALHPKSGPLGKFILNGMQLSLLNKLGQLEDLAYAQQARGAPVNGILLILLKARQLGASTLWQTLLRHRVNFFGNFPALSASIDSQSTQALQRRSDRVWEHMPAWMRARVKRKTIDGGTEFTNGSLIELQDFKQQKDLGKGETWRGFHGTEISVVPQQRAEDHFNEGLFPAIPHDRRVLFGMESTAKGKSGWWYEFCKNVMSGSADGGAGRFDWYFAPFYLIDAFDQARGQRSKCRLDPPPDWQPAQNTILIGERVWDTSHLYMPDHSRVRLDREVLYWYEVTHRQYFQVGKLNIFKQSYPIEPIDAFQHSAAGAFTNETIDRLQQNCARYDPFPYRLMSEGELPEVEQYADAALRPIHHVGPYHLGPMHPDELDNAHKDPRGIVWVFEQPDPRYLYAAASDPAGGIPRWTREARVHNDINKDNGTAQIWRKQHSAEICEPCNGLGWLPTGQKGVTLECAACEGRGKTGGRAVQVVDFAAPIDPEELALYLYVLGRLYKGSSDLDECELIVNRLSMGILTIRTLQNKFSYTNLWQAESTADGMTIKLLDQIGFNEHPTIVPLLHSRGRLLLVRRDMEPRSKFLVEEFSDALIRTVGEARSDSGGALRTYERFVVPPGAGRHDDRMITCFLIGWVLFPVREGEDISEPASDALRRELPGLLGRLAGRELASTDATAADQGRLWNELAGRMLDGQDLDFGHYPDCAADCAAEHHPDEGELAWYTDEGDPYNQDDEDSPGGPAGEIIF